MLSDSLAHRESASGPHDVVASRRNGLSRGGVVVGNHPDIIGAGRCGRGHGCALTDAGSSSDRRRGDGGKVVACRAGVRCRDAYHRVRGRSGCRALVGQIENFGSLFTRPSEYYLTCLKISRHFLVYIYHQFTSWQSKRQPSHTKRFDKPAPVL